MANTAMTCPFSRKMCTDCVLYRARHHYLSLSKPRQGVIDEPKEFSKSGLHSFSDDFELLRKSSEPWAGRSGEARREPTIRIKVIDMENRGTRICSLREAKEWDWTNPRIWRVIDGRQVTNLDRLIEILRYKAEKGFEEVELYEAPRFMLLAGG